MSFFSSLESEFKSFFQTSEAFVLNAIVDIQRGIQVAESDIQIALQWVNSHADDITATVSTVEGVVQSLTKAGVSLPSEVMTAVKDANVAVSALNAYVASTKGGATTPQALVDGYVAAKKVASSAAAAAVAVASTGAVPASVSK